MSKHRYPFKSPGNRQLASLHLENPRISARPIEDKGWACPVEPAHVHQSIERKRTIAPREQVAGIVGIQQAAAGELA
jgi:hypothetical protein